MTFNIKIAVKANNTDEAMILLKSMLKAGYDYALVNVRAVNIGNMVLSQFRGEGKNVGRYFESIVAFVGVKEDVAKMLSAGSQRSLVQYQILG